MLGPFDHHTPLQWVMWAMWVVIQWRVAAPVTVGARLVEIVPTVETWWP